MEVVSARQADSSMLTGMSPTLSISLSSRLAKTQSSVVTTLLDDKSQSKRRNLYLLGFPATHSFAAPIHNYISRSLPTDSPGTPSYIFSNVDCPSLSYIVSLLRSPTFAGAVITMPYKTSITPHLDAIDDVALKIGAVNNVYFGLNGELRGANTDWIGVVGCLDIETPSNLPPCQNKSALVIGAGGAARAAIYALSSHFHCQTIYIANRDANEVSDLVESMAAYPKSECPSLIHVKTVEEARSLNRPYYVVGTVPDLEPLTSSEREASDVVQTILSNQSKATEDGERGNGVVLDMCYYPSLETRLLNMARRAGWTCVNGAGVIAWQMGSQWRLWVGDRAKVDDVGVWHMLRKIIGEREEGRTQSCEVGVAKELRCLH